MKHDTMMNEVIPLSVEKKNLRRIKCLVTAQTLYNLEHMAASMGYSNVGRVIDKLTREKMLELKNQVKK